VKSGGWWGVRGGAVENGKHIKLTYTQRSRNNKNSNNNDAGRR